MANIVQGGRTCSRVSVEEINLMSEFCYFSLFWLDYGQLKKLHTANSNSSTHADWAHADFSTTPRSLNIFECRYF